MTLWIWYLIFLIPNISDIRYFWYPIFPIPNISNTRYIWYDTWYFWYPYFWYPIYLNLFHMPNRATTISVKFFAPFVFLLFLFLCINSWRLGGIFVLFYSFLHFYSYFCIFWSFALLLYFALLTNSWRPSVFLYLLTQAQWLRPLAWWPKEPNGQTARLVLA